MHTHPHDADDLRDLERRLSAWQPAADGLDADAMLFAAGRAAPRPGRFVWPTLAGLLAVLSLVLGGWALAERSGRLALDRPPAPVPLAPVLAPADSAEPPTTDGPPRDGLLSTHRALERGLDSWQPATEDGLPPGDPVPAAAVFTVGRRNDLLDP